MSMLAETMLSPWLVIPLAGITMLITGAHVLSVEISDLDRLRKRLRIVNGLLMMLVAAMLAYALGVSEVVVDPRAQPGSARAFVIVWLIIAGMLVVVVGLAIADAIGTAAYGVGVRKELRREFKEGLAGRNIVNGTRTPSASQSLGTSPAGAGEEGAGRRGDSNRG